jgi:hypothetical protein
LPRQWENFSGVDAHDSIKIDNVPDGSRIVVVSDMQVPMEDRRLLKTLFEDFVPEYKPQSEGSEYHLFLNGDVLDNMSLSRFISQVQRDFHVGDEIDMTKEYLASWRKQFTHGHYVFGNHEARWNKYAWENAPEVAAYLPALSKMLNLEALGYDWVPYLKHYDFEGFMITHGDRTSVNAAKDMLMTYHAPGTSGHVNRPMSYSYTNASGDDPITWYCTGMTCRTDIGDIIKDWGRIQPWQQGFLVGEVWDGVLYPELVRVHHGHFSAGGGVYRVRTTDD